MSLYVGTLKGVGRVYQQTYIDTYAKVAQVKLYKTKTPITAPDMLNDNSDSSANDRRHTLYPPLDGVERLDQLVVPGIVRIE